MTTAEKDLCIAIAKCANRGVRPCDKIACVQSNCVIKQLPEPWNGHLYTAKIMFISSNPSIDCEEHFPNASWADNDICDFFDNRFTYGKKLKNGTKAPVSYWNQLIKYTNIINTVTGGMYFNGILPLANRNNKWDYSVLAPYIVSVEIVHCKSKGERGLSKKCKDFCTNQWLKKIISLFSGDLIVIVGSKAQAYELTIKKWVGSSKKVITAPHPRTNKTFIPALP